jgi:hypothetical protein
MLDAFRPQVAHLQLELLGLAVFPTNLTGQDSCDATTLHGRITNPSSPPKQRPKYWDRLREIVAKSFYPPTLRGETIHEPNPLGLVAVFSVALALSMLAGPFLSSGPPPRGNSDLATALGSSLINATVEIGSNSSNQTPYFWGVAIDGTLNPANRSIASDLNATPIRTLRYGAAWIEQTNWKTGCEYFDNSTCGGITNNVLDYAKLCKWLPNFRCYLGVPAEIDNVTQLAVEVNWLHTNSSGWWPTCWAIGNEPATWTHFGIQWNHWTNNDTSKASATQFARVVQNYTKTLRSLDPNACIVGLESSAPSKTVNLGQWIHNVTTLQPNITEVAFHNYPDGHCYPGTQPLNLANLTRIQYDYEKLAVPNASGIPVDVHEFSIGLGTSPSCSFLNTPANAVFASAVIAQALAAGNPPLAYFRFACGGVDCMLSSHLVATPVYNDYSSVLSHMDYSRIYNLTTNNATTSGTWMVLGATNTGLNQSLLLVNANANSTAVENLKISPAVPPGWKASVYCEYGSGANSSGPLPSNDTVTLTKETTCVVQAGSPCSTQGCGVSMLSSGRFGTIGMYGAQNIGPVNATAHSLLYLAIAQDYSSHAPIINDPTLTWSNRSQGSVHTEAALWAFTATVPSTGIRWHNFTVEAGDDTYFGYIIMDFPSFSGFDPNASSTPSAQYFHSYTASQTISANSESASFVFISSNTASGVPLNLTPIAGQDAFNPGLAPSYKVACVYGIYPASSEIVGGTFNQNESGWIISDAVDLTLTANASVTELASANDVTGNRTTASFTASASDLLYLGISEDYSGSSPPGITDSLLKWEVRGHGSVSTMATSWIFTATVPTGGISGHTLSMHASDYANFAYLLIDLRGALGFDPNGSSVPKFTPFTGSTTPSVSIVTNSQAEFLAFVGNNGDTAATLTPNAGEEVFGSSQDPHHSMSLVFTSGAAGRTIVGGNYSASASGVIFSDAVDLPNSGDATVTELKSLNNTGGTSTVSGITASAGSVLYFVVAQDYSSGNAPVLADTLLDWSVRFHEAISGDSAVWAYTAVVPSGGISGHSFTIKAYDDADKGYLLVDLSGFVGFDRNSSVPAGHYNSATNSSTSILASASYSGCYMAFTTVNMAGSGVTLTPDAGETVMNPNPGPYYAVSMIHESAAAGTLTLGGSFTSGGAPIDEPGWIICDIDDI